MMEDEPKFPPYSGPGSYPLFYMVEDSCLCSDCARNAWRDGERFHPHGFPNWEDPGLHCGVRIESAYAEEE